jgi:hypothetical protein
MMDKLSHSSAKKYLAISTILAEQTSGEGVSRMISVMMYLL